jgi:hypothetical protein
VLQDKRKRGEEWSGPDYLAMVVPPVLNSLVDADARVRYYACEALYNIAKVKTSSAPPAAALTAAAGVDDASWGPEGAALKLCSS